METVRVLSRCPFSQWFTCMVDTCMLPMGLTTYNFLPTPLHIDTLSFFTISDEVICETCNYPAHAYQGLRGWVCLAIYKEIHTRGKSGGGGGGDSMWSEDFVYSSYKLPRVIGPLPTPPLLKKIVTAPPPLPLLKFLDPHI